MNRLDDNKKQTALDFLPTIIDVDQLNSQLTTDSEEDKPFLIIEDWHELGIIQRELNKWISPKAFWANKDRYLQEHGNFENMRFATHGGAPYLIPEGLFDLDDIIDWGFSDEYTTCGNCYKSIEMTPGYYGDKPRYAIINDELLCGDCIVEHYEDDYIESVTNKTSNAINTAIISEERLKELGWKELSKTYTAGLREGSNDNPTTVYNTLKKKYDVVFTYQSDQFDTNFWAWIKKPALASAG